MGSNPIGLKIYLYVLIKSGHRLMVDWFVFQTNYVDSNSTGRTNINTLLQNKILIQEVSNLIGKGLSCHESRCRIETDLTRYI